MYADGELANPVASGAFWGTEHMAGALVIGSMLFLFLIRRGFRGVNVAGVHVGVN